jgi:hypothetical protein
MANGFCVKTRSGFACLVVDRHMGHLWDLPQVDFLHTGAHGAALIKHHGKPPLLVDSALGRPVDLAGGALFYSKENSIPTEAQSRFPDLPHPSSPIVFSDNRDGKIQNVNKGSTHRSVFEKVDRSEILARPFNLLLRRLHPPNIIYLIRSRKAYNGFAGTIKIDMISAVAEINVEHIQMNMSLIHRTTRKLNMEALDTLYSKIAQIQDSFPEQISEENEAKLADVLMWRFQVRTLFLASVGDLKLCRLLIRSSKCKPATLLILFW